MWSGSSGIPTHYITSLPLCVILFNRHSTKGSLQYVFEIAGGKLGTLTFFECLKCTTFTSACLDTTCTNAYNVFFLLFMFKRSKGIREINYKLNDIGKHTWNTYK